MSTIDNAVISTLIVQHGDEHTVLVGASGVAVVPRIAYENLILYVIDGSETTPSNNVPCHAQSIRRNSVAWVKLCWRKFRTLTYSHSCSKLLKDDCRDTLQKARSCTIS